MAAVVDDLMELCPEAHLLSETMNLELNDALLQREVMSALNKIGCYDLAASMGYGKESDLSGLTSGLREGIARLRYAVIALKRVASEQGVRGIINFAADSLTKLMRHHLQAFTTMHPSFFSQHGCQIAATTVARRSRQPSVPLAGIYGAVNKDYKIVASNVELKIDAVACVVSTRVLNKIANVACNEKGAHLEYRGDLLCSFEGLNRDTCRGYIKPRGKLLVVSGTDEQDPSARPAFVTFKARIPKLNSSLAQHTLAFAQDPGLLQGEGNAIALFCVETTGKSIKRVTRPDIAGTYEPAVSVLCPSTDESSETHIG